MSGVFKAQTLIFAKVLPFAIITTFSLLGSYIINIKYKYTVKYIGRPIEFMGVVEYEHLIKMVFGLSY